MAARSGANSRPADTPDRNDLGVEMPVGRRYVSAMPRDRARFLCKSAPAALGAGIVAIAALATAAVHAAEPAPKKLGSFADWEAYAYAEKKGKVCYLLGRPKHSEPKEVKRGDIYLIVSHRSGEKVRDEVSVYVGYPLKDKSEVEAAVGDARFKLFTRDDAAWAKDAQGDRQLVDAMKKGQSLTVKGVSARGTATTDSYSLAGFTAAHNAIDAACK
jgi:invasion protein IalB